MNQTGDAPKTHVSLEPAKPVQDMPITQPTVRPAGNGTNNPSSDPEKGQNVGNA